MLESHFVLYGVYAGLNSNTGVLGNGGLIHAVCPAHNDQKNIGATAEI